MRYVVLFTFLAAPVFADCPAGPDYSADIVDLVQRMQTAPNEGAARELSGEMWEIWLDAPDEAAQSLLDEGVAALRVGNYLNARDKLARLISYCPDYAEGYNQRAFAAYLQRNFEGALADLDAAIALQPVHLGALTGKVLTLIELGRDAEAQIVLRAALEINPWLSERALLIETPGEDI